MSESKEKADTAAKSDPIQTPRRVQSALLWALLAVIIAVPASVLIFNAAAPSLAHRWDDAQERDEETGVLIGAEHIEIGPESATTAVLLVHGFIGATSNFGDLPQKLADAGYRVHVLRLPGHGTTPFDLMKTRGGVIVDAVLLEFLELRKNYEQVFVVGHSLGGALSTLLAAQEKLDGLVLAAPYFKVTHQWYYILRPETWSTTTGGLVKWAYKGAGFIRVNRSEVKDQIVSYHWVPSEALLEANDIAERARDPKILKAIKCPVLLLHSHDDFAASPEAAEESFNQMASDTKSLIWIENSDHHLFWDNDREQVIQSILDFIQTNATT